jgi:RNase P/RNase MRP subunit POP5
MVVKDKIGRKRYVVSYCKMKKTDLESFLREVMSKYHIKVNIIIYLDGYSILKCNHLDKDKFVDLLNIQNFKTFKVTGTIKKAKEILAKIKY